MQNCSGRFQFCQRNLDELAHSTVHPVAPHKEYGFNSQQLVRERLEQDSRALEPRGGLLDERHTGLVCSEVDSFDDSSGFVEVAKLAAHTL